MHLQYLLQVPDRRPDVHRPALLTKLLQTALSRYHPPHQVLHALYCTAQYLLSTVSCTLHSEQLHIAHYKMHTPPGQLPNVWRRWWGNTTLTAAIQTTSPSKKENYSPSSPRWLKWMQQIQMLFLDKSTFPHVDISTFLMWTNPLLKLGQIRFCGQIDCVQDEEQWWTARNSLGQTGSIPVPYVAKVHKTL